MENLVVSLELAKKLRSSGLKQNSCLVWAEFLNKSSTTPNKRLSQLLTGEELEELEERNFIQDLEIFAAPTADEISGQILDRGLTIWNSGLSEEPKYWAQITSGYDDFAYDDETCGEWCKNIVEALALLWLQLERKRTNG